MRSLSLRAIYLLLGCACLIFLPACSGGNGAQVRRTTTLKLEPTTGPGQHLLNQAGQLLSSVQTVHGLFDLTISGSFIKGELESEIWRLAPNRSRSLVQESTLSQFPPGQVDVDDGQQVWEYDPAKKVVYTASSRETSSSATSLFTVGRSSDAQQLIFPVVQNIFEHSSATLVSSDGLVNGHPVYSIHVSPPSQTGGNVAASLNYDGTVSLDKQTHLPLTLNLTLQGLGQVQLTIVSLELNRPLDQTLFTFTPPTGTKVEPFPANTSGSDGNLLTLQQAEQQAGYHLLRIPSLQTAYTFQSVAALGAPGSQIYTLTYVSGGRTFTISESKALANLPVSGQILSLHGTTATLATTGSGRTLSWTEQGVGVQISGSLDRAQIEAIADMLA